MTMKELGLYVMLISGAAGVAVAAYVYWRTRDDRPRRGRR